MKNLLFDIWLSLACTPGKKTFNNLMGHFSSSEQIYNADEESIASVIGTRSSDYKALCNKNTSAAEKILDFCERRGVGILSYFDKAFPISLKSIKNPPVLLYYRGKLPNFNESSLISVVGTRRLTSYGKMNTFKISHDLARAGAIIVSGLAHGIDGVALAGALAAEAPTVAVIGSGIDVCYPKEHTGLAREIVKRGCVLTEYPPKTKPNRFNFPVRNRIISALSKATVVMEGRERSGSVITAHLALEQGRTVYAFPGNVGNQNSEATHLLIKGGAKLFTSADDIISDFHRSGEYRLNPFNLLDKSDVDMNKTLSELQVSCVTVDDAVFKIPWRKRQSGERNAQKPSANENKPPQINDNNGEERIKSELGERLSTLYKKLSSDTPLAIDDLIDEDFTLREVMQGILKLEISGYVEMLPGDRVKRKI